MLTDPLADFLNKIRNAVIAQHETVETPYSRLKNAVAELMVKRGFLSEAKTEEQEDRRTLVVYLNPDRNQLSLKRVSKPGQRIYIGSKAIKHVKNGLGMGIYSTSRGILSDREVRQLKIGGEYLCEIY